MNKSNAILLEKHKDILSFRDLAAGTIATYISYYLTNCMKVKNLHLIHKLRKTVYGGNPYRRMKSAELILSLYGTDICVCPKCSGKMLRLARAQPEHAISYMFERVTANEL